MDADLFAIAARHLERLLIVLAGAMSIVLGYRMFLAIPRGGAGSVDTGEGRIELPGGISIFVTRVGPGVFFALFGATILGLGLQQGLRLHDVLEHPDPARADGAAPAGMMRHVRSYSSIGPAGGSAEQQQTYRTGTVDTVLQLARLSRALEGQGGSGLNPQDRQDYRRDLRNARVRLLASVWDEPAWGPYGEFERWVHDGATAMPPAALATVARAYRGDQ